MNAQEQEIAKSEVECTLRYRWARIRYARQWMLETRENLKVALRESCAPSEALQGAKERHFAACRNLVAARSLPREDLFECLQMKEVA